MEAVWRTIWGWVKPFRQYRYFRIFILVITSYSIHYTKLYDDEELEAKMAEIKEKLGEFDAVVTMSAQYSMGIPRLLDALELV